MAGEVNGHELLDEDELVARFKQLTVRRIQFTDWFWGAGILGGHKPTGKARREGRIHELGTEIDRLVSSGEAALRVYALSDTAILRREQYPGYYSDRTYTRPVGGDPIHAAQVTGIAEVNIGLGRTLPLLSLMEFKSPPIEREFVVSLPDMARYIQDGEVKLHVDT